MAEHLPFASASTAAEHSGGFTQRPGLNVMRGRAVLDDADGRNRGKQSAVVQAHRYAQGAEDASRKGDHAEATELHLAAARDFLRAAEQIQEHGVLASSLLLLADSHAARAEKGAIRQRLTADGRRSLNGDDKNSSFSSSSRDLTPAEAYRAAATGTHAPGTKGKGATNSNNNNARGGGVLTDRQSQSAIGPDMEDSIMRGTGANSIAGPADGGGGAVAELAKKFRPQRDDLLELERQLAKLGLDSKTGGTGRARHHRLGNNGTSGAGGGAPHLSSALGDSFFFLNKSVIFGGAGTGNGTGGVGVGLGSPTTRFAASPSAARGPGSGGVGGGLASPRFSESNVGAPGATVTALDGRSGSDRSGAMRSRLSEGRERRGVGDEGTMGTRDTQDAVGKSSTRRATGIGADRSPTGGVVGGRASGGGASVEGGGGVGGDGRSRLSAKEEARRAEEEKAQQGEIMRLLTCLKTLGDENAALMKECEDRDKVRQESQSIREEMRRFQFKYHERFTLLKKTLDEVVRSYPQLAAQPGNAGGVAAGGAAGADGARATEEVQRLAQSNRKLTEQVKKYENYYKELCLKAESKRKEQLSQAKAARQQQLAHHPSFGQQQQQQQKSPEQQQQQQQKQRVQRRLSPAPSVPRRALQQQQQQQSLPPQTRRSTSAPSAHQQQQQVAAAAAAAASGSHPQQHYPAFSQQHFRQNQQQQHQPQLPHAGSSQVVPPGYRAGGSSQVPTGGAVAGASSVVRGRAGMGGLPAAVGAVQQPQQQQQQQPTTGGTVDRSAGLNDESDV